jgi:addiction module RelE/StbE family toxin
MENRYDIIVYPAAANDMDNIFDYIAKTLSNLTAALGQIDDFESAFERIASHPNSCPKAQSEYIEAKGYRKLVVNNYIAFYLVDDDAKEVHVVRVLYGFMNFQDIL